MLGTSSIADEKIKRLKEEIHELKLPKGEVINVKTAMMQERDATESVFMSFKPS